MRGRHDCIRASLHRTARRRSRRYSRYTHRHEARAHVNSARFASRWYAPVALRGWVRALRGAAIAPGLGPTSVCLCLQAEADAEAKMKAKYGALPTQKDLLSKRMKV